jgi:phosphomannomutase/phosphoglucomutase
MNIQKIFKNYDIRGLVPKEINSKIAFEFGKGFASYLGNFGKIVVGRDIRKSSEKLKNSLVDGLIHAGCDVIDIGLSTSDMVAWSVKNLKADGGVMITASHLSQEWNGFKFFQSDGRIYGMEELKQNLLPLLKNKKILNSRKGRIENNEITEDYISSIISRIQRINGKKSLSGMKIVFDGFNGMGSIVVPKILKRLNADVIEINTNLNKGFAKPPEPKEETMKEISQKVLELKADLGIACDGDADRVLFVDDNGNFVPGDETLIFAAMKYVNSNQNVVFSLDVSQKLVKYLEEKKRCRVVYSKIGDFFVTENMLKYKAVFGGQPNGHMKDPNFVLYDSGPFFATFLPSLLSSLEKKLSELRRTLPSYYKFTKSIHHKNPKVAIKKLIKKVKEKNCEILSELDGIKFNYQNSTFLIRPSGTENNLRLIAESEDEESVKSGLEEVIKWIEL